MELFLINIFIPITVARDSEEILGAPGPKTHTRIEQQLKGTNLLSLMLWMFEETGEPGGNTQRHMENQ